MSSSAKTALILAGASAIAAGVVVAAAAPLFSPMDSTCCGTEEKSILHFASNALFYFHVPLARLGQPLLTAVLTALSAAGTALLVWSLTAPALDASSPNAGLNGGLSRAQIGAGLAALLLPWVFGQDVASLSVAAGAVLGAFLLRLMLSSLRSAGAAAGFSLMQGAGSILLAGPLALIPAMFSLAAGADRLQRSPITIRRALVFVLLAATFIAALEWPVPATPEYPLAGRLVDHYDISAYSGPRFGADIYPPIIDREYEREAFYPLSLALLLLCALSGIRSASTGAVGRMLLLACGAHVLILLDSTLLSPGVTQVMPLQALRRMVPGWSHLPFVSAFACTTAVFSFAALFAAGTRIGVAAVFLTAAVTAAQDRVAARAVQPIASHEHSSVYRDPGSGLAHSPSYAVARTAGADVFLQSARRRGVQPVGLPEADIEASAFSSEAGASIDGSPETRWSPKQGRQAGEEWLHVAFRERQSFDGLLISPGTFQTDFPRGLEIAVADRCGKNGAFDEYRTLYRDPEWKGGVGYTEQGYPYYEPRHSVRIVFASTVTAKCLLIRQIGADRHYDWSVAELELLRASN